MASMISWDQESFLDLSLQVFMCNLMQLVLLWHFGHLSFSLQISFEWILRCLNSLLHLGQISFPSCLPHQFKWSTRFLNSFWQLGQVSILPLSLHFVSHTCHVTLFYQKRGVHHNASYLLFSQWCAPARVQLVQ